MLSNYGAYIYEREGKAMLEDAFGFAIYSYPNADVCYIEEIFVQREHRKANHASRYADTIAESAKSKGCKRLMGSVNLNTKNSTTSMRVLLAYGFELFSANNNMIYLTKELEA